jgi:predicted phage terminase large subunit-like protein
MGRPCTICQHPKRSEIERAYAKAGPGKGGGAKGVAERFGVGRMALVRHAEKKGKCQPVPAKGTAAKRAAPAKRPSSSSAEPKPPIPAEPEAPPWQAWAKVGLLAFIPRLSPEFAAPHHLADWCQLIERAAGGEPVRALCAVPIRHHKSQTTMHGVAWALVQDPGMRILVLTFSFARAIEMGARIRELCERCGVGPVYGSNKVEKWSNAAGGGVACMSAAQSRLGADVHLVIFDDPLDEHDAQSFNERSAVDDTITHYTARCMRRGRPGGVLGVMSRWHPDDPIGRRLARRERVWEYVHHPAIIEDAETGEERAFAPEIWPIDELRKMRAELREQDPTERLWWAQFQGEPRDASGALFRADPERYTALPHGSFRLVYGCDLAWSTHAGSDFFALVALKIYGAKAYVIESRRTKLETPAIEGEVRAMQARHGPGPLFAYVSGPEKGIVRNLQARGFRFVVAPARYNKLVRAEKTIRRHNDGDILYPVSASWVGPLFARMEVFRGEDKGHDDDEIDALVAGCDMGMGGGGAPKALGKNYAGGSDVSGSMRDFR